MTHNQTTTPPVSVARELTCKDLFDKEVRASLAAERAANERAREVRTAFYDGKRRKSDLDQFVNNDPTFKTLVADQQFANRKAQMYGLGALMDTLVTIQAQNVRIQQLLTDVISSLKNEP